MEYRVLVVHDASEAAATASPAAHADETELSEVENTSSGTREWQPEQLRLPHPATGRLARYPKWLHFIMTEAHFNILDDFDAICRRTTSLLYVARKLLPRDQLVSTGIWVVVCE